MAFLNFPGERAIRSSGLAGPCLFSRRAAL